jgi:DNA-binding protein YbaB
MSSPLNDQVEEAIAEFKQQHDKLLETRQKLEKETASASSKDHLITVTATVAGAVKEIKFHRTDYASMPPAELSAVLVETISAAREKSATLAREAFLPFGGLAGGLRESLAGGSDLDELFAPVQELLDSVQLPEPTSRAEDDVDG